MKKYTVRERCLNGLSRGAMVRSQLAQAPNQTVRASRVAWLNWQNAKLKEEAANASEAGKG